MPASASAGRAQMGLVLSGSKGFWQKNRRPGYSALRRRAGEEPDRRPALLPRIFPHYPARTRTRDGALEHAELAPGSDDATKKLDAKGRPVEFKQLLRIQRHYQRPQGESTHRGRWLDLESRCFAPFTSFSGQYRWQEAAASGSRCPVLAFARSLDPLDQRAPGQARRDHPRRHLRASNLRAERRGWPRLCAGTCCSKKAK